MSDQQAADAVEEEPSAQGVEAPEPVHAETEQEAPPWGDDFDPERAWKTIQAQREREAELEPLAREYKRLQTDENAFAAFLAERGYELAEDDESEPVEFADPEDERAARIEALEQWKEAREQAEQQAEEEAYADQVYQSGEAQFDEWKVNAEDRPMLWSYAMHVLPRMENGLPDIKTAFDRFQERDNAKLKGWTQSKKGAARVPANGGEGTERPSTDGMTEAQVREARHERMVARLAAEQG